MQRIKPYISLWDKAFKISQTRNYYLTMRLSLHGFSFAVFNPQRNKFIGLEAYRFSDIKDTKALSGKLDLILNRHEWFVFHFKRVVFLYHNVFTTLVPTPLFDEEKKSLFLGFNQPFAENQRILYDHLKNVDAVNIYYTPNPVVEKVRDFWPNAHLAHSSSALIDCLARNFKNKIDKDTVFIHVNDIDFNFISFKNNKLFFHNVFKYKTKEDFIYFLLATIEQLGYNPETTDVIIMGEIEKSDEIFSMINQYIGRWHFIKQNDNLIYSYLLEKVPEHRFYLLFNALQCEL